MKHLLLWGLVVPAVLRKIVPAWLLESPLAVAVRHPWLTLGAAVAGLALAGLLVVASGVVPIAASSGHWAMTAWFLQFAKQRSVATHALFVAAPPSLDDEALVLRGAGQFESGCRACHGAPGDRLPVIPAAMTPPPPALSPRIQGWSDRELFYIVKHGIKFTGMPAWPAQQRDDEVWSVVAFLRELPGLTREEYRTLVRSETTAIAELTGGGAAGTESPPDVVSTSCARCHGLDGVGPAAGAYPKLAGQRAEYLDRALRAYADRRRYSGIMQPIAAALPADARESAVRYYASLPPAAATRVPAAGPGAVIATMGVPERLVPACVECHGPAAAPKNDAYPILAGQYANYLQQQLALLQQRRRGGSEYVHLMHSFVDRLTSDQIEQVSAYFASVSASADPEGVLPAAP